MDSPGVLNFDVWRRGKGERAEETRGRFTLTLSNVDVLHESHFNPRLKGENMLDASTISQNVRVYKVDLPRPSVSFFFTHKKKKGKKGKKRKKES